MSLKKLKIATVFSGIGAFEHALKRMNIPHEIIFACDNGDVDIFGKKIEPEYSIIENSLIECSNLLNTLDNSFKLIKFSDDKEKKHITNEFKLFNKNMKEELKNLKNSLSSIGKGKQKTDYKLLAEMLGMSFEKINTYKVQLELLTITDKNTEIMYKKRKEYIDSLYNKKEKQNKVKQSYFANYDISNENFHWNVKLLDGNQYKDKVDIFVGGSPCFVAGTKVYTKNGYKAIEKLKVGDEVLTHKNRFKKIIRIGNTPNQSIWEIVSADGEKFLTTANHPFMVSRKKSNKFSEPKFKRVDEINLSDYLVGPKEIGNSEKGYLYTEISSIRKGIDTKTVYNIEVEEDHTYMVLTKFVHNCQAFSISGKRRGFEDTRGTLFYEYARLVKEIQPKVFIYENVKGMLNHDKGNTWKTIQAVFDELGYKYSFKLMNAKDYGIPQSRPRIFVVGFRKDLVLKKEFEFPEGFELKHTMQDFLMDNVSGRFYLRAPQINFITNEMRINKKYTQIDGDIALCQKKCQQYNLFGDFIFVEENKDIEKTMEELDKYFLSDKVEKYVMSTGTKGFQVKPKIDNEIASTLTKTMHKMHRASIDNYVTTDGRLRKLTPRECLRLMGFCDSFKIEVSDTAAYMQSGNSIVVDVLMFIMSSILDCYDFDLDLNEIQRPTKNMLEKIFEKQEDGSYIEKEDSNNNKREL